MNNSQINKKNMVKATNVSQKECKSACGVSRPEEIRLKQIVEQIKLTASFDLYDWLFIHIDRVQIEADIEKYKQVLVTYKIIQQ